jgi:16S rRNA U516 pseudouridylate synthase RsuA-like enzyme
MAKATLKNIRKPMTPDDIPAQAAACPDDPNATAKVSLYINKAKYRKIKVIAADTDQNVQEIVDQAMDLVIAKYNRNGS